MDGREIIARNIVYHRKRLGLSQLELADKLQYSNKNISKWEKGETTPSVFTLKRLAEIFGVTVDDLLVPPPDSEQGDLPQKKARPENLKVKFTWLLLANAILLIVTFLAIYVLALCGVQAFNKWLLLSYVAPFMALSVVIFVRCVFKFVSIIALSSICWLTALAIYLSGMSAIGSAYVFLLAFAVQLLFVAIALLNNFKLLSRLKKRLREKRSGSAKKRPPQDEK